MTSTHKCTFYPGKKDSIKKDVHLVYIQTMWHIINEYPMQS